MLKKYLSISLFVLTFVFVSVNHSFAYTSWTNSCASNSDTETVFVISSVDLSGSIPICATAEASSLDITITDTTNNNSFSITSADSVGSGKYIHQYPFTFQSGDIGQAVKFSFTAKDANGNDASNAPARLTVNVNAVTPALTISPSTTVNQGDNVTLSCTNSTELYVDGTVVDRDYNGSKGYNLNYSSTAFSVGTHQVACMNLGGNSNKDTGSFTVKDVSCPTGQHDFGKGCVNVCSSNSSIPASDSACVMSGAITPHDPSCTIASGASSCTTNISWSTTNPEGISAITSPTNKYGVLYTKAEIANKDNELFNNNKDTQSVTISYPSRDFYLYNNTKLLDQTTGTASCTSGTTWDGSKCVANPVCPSVGDDNLFFL